MVELSKHRAAIRAAIGILQGLALYVLFRAIDQKIWPATDRSVLSPLALVVAFVPLILLFGIGNLRPRTLLIWAGSATTLLVGLAVHDVTRATLDAAGLAAGPERGLPSFVVFSFTALGVFITQALITAGDSDRRILAAYPKYFDAAWKHAMQILLAVLFVGLFWLVLFLGSALLDLVKIEFLSRLIRHAWFAIPVTALAFALAIHLTDVRASIISGVRTLIHIVLSWLLPAMAIIVGIFLAGLPVTGLDPLWKTSHAGLLLLAVATVLTALINAVYRDGSAEQAAPRFLRIAATLAAVELVPIVGIAVFALGLRVNQYGWTVLRVYAAAATVVAAWHAVGYFIVVARPGVWLKGLERCNVFGAFLILATMLTLLTPVADPARIAVANQMARLKSGRTAPDRFDYDYLRWEGERYGTEALNALAADPRNVGGIEERARRALQRASRGGQGGDVPTENELAESIKTYPAGRALPDTFVKQKWPTDYQWSRPQCLRDRTAQCEAFLVDLDGDGVDDVIVSDMGRESKLYVFKLGATGAWAAVGQLIVVTNCPGVLAALRAGQFTLAASPWKNLQVAGQTLQLSPSLPEPANCQ